jgi:nitrate/nitrite transport system substrate-binding protein
MRFYNNGVVNTPLKSHAIWFLAQYVRFGMLKSAPDYKGIAEKLILDDLWAEVAKETGVPIQADMKGFKTNLDVAFDPSNPAAYLGSTRK